MVIYRKCLISYRNTMSAAERMRSSGRQRRQKRKKRTDLLGAVQRSSEESRGCRGRASGVVLARKPVGVVLPGRVVVAARSVDQQQVSCDPGPESRAGGAIRPVDIG